MKKPVLVAASAAIMTFAFSGASLAGNPFPGCANNGNGNGGEIFTGAEGECLKFQFQVTEDEKGKKPGTDPIDPNPK